MSFVLSRLEAELKTHEILADGYLKKMEDATSEEEIFECLELSEKASRKALRCSFLIAVISGISLNEREGEFDA